MKIKSPVKRAIREKCLDCSENAADASNCHVIDCSLYPYRKGAGPRGCLRPIRQKCMECANGQAIEIRNCPVKDCSLYPYRFGRLPQNGPVCAERVPREGVFLANPVEAALCSS